VVVGSEDNLKITYPRDLAIAETLLQDRDGGISS
jgi:2-C-methyl-D-erythritol 4-phosphate cytidylyltransferase